MDTVKNIVLTLLRGALKGETVSVDTPFSFEQVIKEAARHGVENLLFYGLRAAGFTTADPQMKALLHTVGENIFTSENQVAAANAVCRAFDQNGIDYMPLKGLTLREKYPAADMRTMGDADILIRTAQYPAIQKVLPALGFTPVLESDHELVWQQGNTLYLELHKSLFPSYDTDFYAVFGDGWGKAQQTENATCYALTPEDGFVYIFTHFAKHYIDGGIGLRHLADLWVYLQAYPSLDMTYVNEVLEVLQLRKFYDNVRATFCVWLEDAEETPVTAHILDTVWQSGLYGTVEEHQTASAERHTVSSTAKMKSKRLWQFMFPAYAPMSYAYPVLKKAPILLPFVWVWRWLTKAVLHPKKVLQKSETLMAPDDDAVYSRQAALRLVGLTPAADREKK